MTDTIRIAVFDIGYKNYAFYVEEFSISKLKELCVYEDIFPDDGSKVKKKNFPKQIQSEVLKKLYSNGKSIEMVNTSLVKYVDPSSVKFNPFQSKFSKGKQHFLNQDLFLALTEHLDSYMDLWCTCSGFFIEEQVKWNKLAQRLEQHTYSYFTIKFPFQPTGIFPSPNKTKILLAPKYTKAERKKKLHKKWAVDKAQEILKGRGEIGFLIDKMLSLKGKNDDLSDCIIMLQAVKYRIYIDRAF